MESLLEGIRVFTCGCLGFLARCRLLYVQARLLFSLTLIECGRTGTNDLDCTRSNRLDRVAYRDVNLTDFGLLVRGDVVNWVVGAGGRGRRVGRPAGSQPVKVGLVHVSVVGGLQLGDLCVHGRLLQSHEVGVIGAVADGGLVGVGEDLRVSLLDACNGLVDLLEQAGARGDGRESGRHGRRGVLGHVGKARPEEGTREEAAELVRLGLGLSVSLHFGTAIAAK